VSIDPLASPLRKTPWSDFGAPPGYVGQVGPAAGDGSAAPARGHLRALTGLRFVAAVHVLSYHTTSWSGWSAGAVRNIVGAGYVAVAFFFVLSGFILAYVHAPPEGPGGPGDRRDRSSEGRRARGPWKNARPADFYARRFARIYPAYIFALALIAPTFLWHTFRTVGLAELARQAFPVLLLVQAFIPAAALAWNPPAWSLSAEAFFYLLFPFVAPRLVGLGRKAAVAAFVGVYALTFIGPLLYLWLAPDGPGPATHATYTFWLNVLRYDPIVRLPEFLLGILLGRLYLGAEWPPSVRALLGSPAGATALSAGAAALALALLAASGSIPYPLVHNGLLAPVFALLIVSLAPGRGALAACLATPAMVLLGEASYSLYLIHVPLGVIWDKIVHPLMGPRYAGTLRDWSAFVAFAVAASIGCYRFVERPLQKRVLRAIAKPKPR
jgi:peptidoglycan/LPS O-acetylase OafA/YrhL